MGSYNYKNVDIERISHAAFKLSNGGIVVYIDPYNIPEATKDGDVVICTHDHFDHCSPTDIKKVAKPDATIVAPGNCRGKIKDLGLEFIQLDPGEEKEVKGVSIRAIPAYNIGKRFHPKAYGGIGVIVKIAGVSVYHAGDTDFIPEMKELEGKVDVALLPVSGVYVMDVDEAVKAAEAIKPKVVIPMHYGAIVGSDRDAEAFREKVSGKYGVVII